MLLAPCFLIFLSAEFRPFYFSISFSLQDGLKPIQTAALRSNREAVIILFPLTSPIQKIKDWSVDAVIDFMQSEFKKEEVLKS